MSTLGYYLRKLGRELGFLLGFLFGHRAYLKVVIVTRSRSGSNLLCSLLESHPAAFVWREVFRRPHYLTPALTEYLVNGRYLRRYRAVFYKVFYYHRVPAGFWDRLIVDEEIRIIHLVRRNYLDTFVSQREAAASGRWESFSRGSKPKSTNERLHVKVGELMEFLERCEAEINSFEARIADRRNVLSLTFDQVASAEGLDAIRSFLGGHLDPAQFGRARNVRQASGALEQRISNFAEVHAAIMASRWRHLLDQGHTPSGRTPTPSRPQ
jgi:hypothetical protein